MSGKYYLPKYFSVRELVPLEIYTEMGDGAIILLDDRILRVLDEVREHFDVPVTVNNWHLGGPFKQRGLRTEQVPGGAAHGAHFYGRAADFDVMNMTAEQVRHEILANQQENDFSLITGMETGIPWVHLDVANRYSSNGIVQFTSP
jgi:Peptidase M15